MPHVVVRNRRTGEDRRAAADDSDTNVLPFPGAASTSDSTTWPGTGSFNGVTADTSAMSDNSTSPSYSGGGGSFDGGGSSSDWSSSDSSSSCDSGSSSSGD